MLNVRCINDACAARAVCADGEVRGVDCTDMRANVCISERRLDILNAG